MDRGDTLWDKFHKDLEELFHYPDDELAKELWSALTNSKWTHPDDPDGHYGLSFRGAGGFVAELRHKGESYMDFYMCADDGVCSERVAEAMATRGWSWAKWT